jgi:DNA-binding response OmpR family regulator
VSEAGRRVAAIVRDPAFLAALALHAEAAGLGFWRSDEPIGAATAKSMRLDAMVLDPEALGEAGWAYLETLCEAMPELGLVICTGRTSMERRVRGLRRGADDWLTKPAHPEEVLARVEAVSRAGRGRIGAEDPVEVGELRLHPPERRAFLSGRDLGLSRQEFDLLLALARTRGEVLEREAIYRLAWGYSMAPGDRSVDVFVARLRQRLAEHRPDRTYIHTHFRIGYRFEPGVGSGVPHPKEPVEGGGPGHAMGHEGPRSSADPRQSRSRRDRQEPALHSSA